MNTKKYILSLILVIIGSSLTACASENEVLENTNSKVLVAYFSCTGTTEGIANKIHQAAGGDIYRIKPQIEYTSTDLNYNTDCRANLEQNEDTARPAIKGDLPNIADYNVIFLGYPIWWGIAPRIIQTFLESKDFSGKTIIPFCTSGGSGISGSYAPMKQSAPGADLKEGRRFDGNTPQSTINEWVQGVGWK